MRWTLFAPLIAMAACVAAVLVLLAPVLTAAPWLEPAGQVRWIAAPDDGRPRRPMAGERVSALGDLPLTSTGAARQYWFAFDRGPSPAKPIGVLVLPAGGKTRLFVNGLELAPERAGPHAPGRLAEVPRSGLQAGINRIEVIAPAAAPPLWPRGVFLGPIEPLRAAEARLARIGYMTTRATAFLGGASALLGFLLAFTLKARRILEQLSALALLLAGQAALAWLAPEGGFLPWPWLGLVLTASAALLLLFMTGAEAGWGRWPRIGFRIGVGALAALALAAPLTAWVPQAAWMLAQAAATLAVVGGAGTSLTLLAASPALRAAWSPLQRSTGALAALALLASTLAAIDGLGPWTLIFGSTLAGVSAGVALAAWFAWVVVRAFLDIEAALQRGVGLGRLVREQQAQLAAQQEALELEAGRRAVLEERERLSRDIHDGVGGSLTSLLLQARTGGLKGARLETGLQQALDELRLMIDALDHSPETLAAAFSVLQTRVAPAFRAAGMALDWRQEDLGSGVRQDPRSLFQVFRILQEACTNAIRHSGASAVQVRIGWEAEAGALKVEVEDNGSGGGAENAPGNGLRNMKERALRIGGTLTAGPLTEGKGWRVRLLAPITQT